MKYCEIVLRNKYLKGVMNEWVENLIMRKY